MPRTRSKQSLPFERDPSRPINDTSFQRARVFLLHRILRRWTYYPDSKVLLLPFNLVLKYGRQVSLSEAHILEFVARNSQIPVPRVITAFQSKNGQRCILMSRMPGVPLCSKFGLFSEEAQRNILRQLRGYIDQLRAIPPPKSGFIGAVILGPIRDDRVCSGPFGPFKTVQEFHKALRDGIDGNSGHPELGREGEQARILVSTDSRRSGIPEYHRPRRKVDGDC